VQPQAQVLVQPGRRSHARRAANRPSGRVRAYIQAAELGLELAATSLHPVRGVANTIRCQSAWKPGCP